MQVPSDILFQDLHGSNPSPLKTRNVVLLDRDGVIIEEKNYLKDPAQVELVSGSAEAIGALNAANVFVAVVSNQAGVARGLLNLRDVNRVNARTVSLLAERHASIDALVACPYHPDGTLKDFARDSKFRKPEVGMYEFLRDFYGLKGASLFMVGDKYSDAVFGERIHAETYLVQTGYGIEALPMVRTALKNVRIAKDLQEAVQWILKSPQLKGI